MRPWISRARRALVVAGLAVGVSVPIVAIGAPDAGAALPPVVGCGFHLGRVTEEGAAGTLFFFAELRPNSPAQHCTAAVTFTAAVHATGTQYTNIDNNPFTATQTVSFVPARLAPVLGVRWGGLHCADPAGPGNLSFATGGQVASLAVDPSTCGPSGQPHSAIAPFAIGVVSAVGIAPTLDGLGYRTVSEAGTVTSEGDATPIAGAATNVPIVAIQTAPTGNGVWTAASDGGVFAYGTAAFHGSLGAVHLNSPVVGMAATPSGNGYWMVASDGGVFAFGDAVFSGSLGAVHLNAPVVGMARGQHTGYWLVASDGGIFGFGGVPFEGSTGSLHLNAPISGMAATATGAGYWLVGADNGIFTFGDAQFFGSQPITP